MRSVDNFPRFEFDDEESKKRPEEQVTHLQAYHSPDSFRVMAQKRPPILSHCTRVTCVPHVFLDRAFADAKVQFEQLALDTFGSEDADCSWPSP
jgi:hypothetical protein